LVWARGVGLLELGTIAQAIRAADEAGNAGPGEHQRPWGPVASPSEAGVRAISIDVLGGVVAAGKWNWGWDGGSAWRPGAR